MTLPREINTPRLRLRPFRAEDLDDLLDYALHEAFWRYLPLDPQTPETVQTFLSDRLAEPWDDSGLTCAVELADHGKVIGSVRIAVRDARHRSGDLGYALNSRFTGHGYMTEAVEQVIALGFEALGLHRIWASCDKDNMASWRLMERVGMRREGLLRGHKLLRGSWRDSYLYAILPDDF